jgi:glycosyltransferase involved in cell wall biosynthesis
MNDKRKVMVVLPNLGVGGGERMAIEIVHNIKNPDIVFKFISLYPQEGTVLDQLIKTYDIDIEYLNKSKGFDWKTVVDLDKAIKAFKPDVVHAHLRVMPHLLWPLIKNKVETRYYTVHNLAEKDGAGGMKYVLKTAFKIGKVTPVAISDICKRSIANYYGIDLKNIPCIYNGVDTNRYTRKKSYTEMDTKSINFVAIGRLARVKNYPLLIEAFRELYQKYKNVHLTIVGEGEEIEQIRAQVEREGLQNVIDMVGVCSDVRKYLDLAHIYVMSSDWEGLPLTVLEAMSMGLPIVSTKAGGVSDVVVDGENGILVECGDQEALTEAMGRLVESKELRDDFSENSSKLSKKYSIENCAMQYERLYLK